MCNGLEVKIEQKSGRKRAFFGLVFCPFIEVKGRS